jgi:hypothetical protein
VTRRARYVGPVPPRLRLALSALLVVAACAAAVASASSKHSAAPGSWCGGRLWRLETLSDGDSGSVQLRPASQTSIAAIAARQGPTRITTGRDTAFQRQTWRLQTVVDRFRIASDGEIVLILFSIDTGIYMNAYLPNPDCLSAQTRNRTGIVAARDEFRSRCGPSTWAWQLLGATVDIAGVGFWNPVRDTRGALPNGAELRPVTNLKVLSGCGVG